MQQTGQWHRIGNKVIGFCPEIWNCKYFNIYFISILHTDCWIGYVKALVSFQYFYQFLFLCKMMFYFLTAHQYWKMWSVITKLSL